MLLSLDQVAAFPRPSCTNGGRSRSDPGEIPRSRRRRRRQYRGEGEVAGLPNMWETDGGGGRNISNERSKQAGFYMGTLRVRKASDLWEWRLRCKTAERGEAEGLQTLAEERQVRFWGRLFLCPHGDGHEYRRRA